MYKTHEISYMTFSDPVDGGHKNSESSLLCFHLSDTWNLKLIILLTGGMISLSLSSRLFSQFKQLRDHLKIDQSFSSGIALLFSHSKTATLRIFEGRVLWPVEKERNLCLEAFCLNCLYLIITKPRDNNSVGQFRSFLCNSKQKLI